MRKIKYIRPTIKVVKLQQNTQLLTLSHPGYYENGGDPWNNVEP